MDGFSSYPSTRYAAIHKEREGEMFWSPARKAAPHDPEGIQRGEHGGPATGDAAEHAAAEAFLEEGDAPAGCCAERAPRFVSASHRERIASSVL
jgi:hypothetical protein